MSLSTQSDISKKNLNEHSDIIWGKVGVLLVNLGTPNGYDKKSVRRYLKEFLSDRRVIEIPRLIWWPLLNGIILNVRPKRSSELYKSIWNKEQDESPLMTFTRSQSAQLSKYFSYISNLIIDWGMRYGDPSIEGRLKILKKQGCERILIFPLYPQYSATTTATVNDKAFNAFMKMRWMPAIRTVPPYHDDPHYIQALANSIESHLKNLDFQPDHMIASYHGIPKTYFDKGDPYPCHCLKTSRLLREKMGWDDGFLISTFQSRFGPEEWLKPYTDKTVEKLAYEGVKRICVINPGFSSDCLETLEEIAVEVCNQFIKYGGENFSHIPCLNDSHEGIMLIKKIIKRETQGWI
ncbi:ferrochelatase [Candidatus Endowatersipora endosymbiont of Watersipora subatra]|uniref:ferrochelatase n=1 Tax=Candidatus Endowatersipora endosymbiont of Watersipora subatra TaxID=3077946 RepID=UPI00312CA84A